MKTILYAAILALFIASGNCVAQSNKTISLVKLTDRQLLILSYKDTIKVDTVIVLNRKDTIAINLRHYCTYDGKINVPKNYLEESGETKLTTHNFVSLIKIKHNSKIVYNGFINKDKFENQKLDDELKKYGVLYYNGIGTNNYKDKITITYRVSIPLNDLYGSVLMINISPDGQISYPDR